jgi:hypothetical protein
MPQLPQMPVLRESFSRQPVLKTRTFSGFISHVKRENARADYYTRPKPNRRVYPRLA